MSKGYEGLKKQQGEVQTLVRENAGLTGEYSSAGAAVRHGSLQIVSVDRRKANRFDVAVIAPQYLEEVGAYRWFKRCLDIIGASVAVIALSPLIGVIVAISFVSSGSPIFRHRRIGRNGKFFYCLKFRTMVRNADSVLQNLLDSDRHIKEEWLRDHKLKNDPRITRLGKFLRRTSLDELPQLWNVLRGEMSLVGPRPVVPDELARYGNKVTVFLSALPGITGLWQVSGRNDMDYRRRVALDVCYVRSRSLTLDLYILLKTLPAVFAKSGAY